MTDTDLSTRELIIDTATRIFSDGCDHAVVEAAQEGTWPEQLWSTLAANGLLEIGLAESGTGLAELFEFLRVSGRFAAPLPLLDCLLAQVALGKAALATAFAELQAQSGPNPSIELSWPERFDAAVVLDVPEGRARLVSLAGLKPTTVDAMLGEPVGRIELGNAWDNAADTEFAAPDLYALAALGRSAQMCGGLEASLNLAISYCSEREQFGRAISKFQAIQHQLAVLAAEVAASQRATDAAIHSAATSSENGSALRASDVAVAKVRVGAAVGVGAEIAHQVHGAMGFTMEYSLHQLTRRLWSWRDQFGTESDWATLLGEELCAGTADDLWAYVASHG